MSDQQQHGDRVDLVDAGNGHHALSAHEVVLLLETDVSRGLSDHEAQRRLERFGPNELAAASGGGPLLRLLSQFHHPLIYILLVAGSVTLALGEEVDAVVIFGVVLVNAAIGFVQESRAEAALDALRAMVTTRARIRRDGQERTIESAQIVPGDVVLIEAGDKVPVDLRLVRVAELQIDESALTGESVPVAKDEVLLDDHTPMADRRNMVYSGSLVSIGTGLGVAVATGAQTELGAIHRLVGTAESLATPLTRKLTWFSKILTVAILSLAAATFAIGVFRGEEAAEMMTAAVALAVGAIPEGLPAAFTITLAIGVSRMARHGAVIRRMPAVETLGSTTVVCADKTGTLTENQMTVRVVWTPDTLADVTGSGYQPDGTVRDETGATVDLQRNAAMRWTLVAGGACNDARMHERDGKWDVLGDPTEAAMLVAAAKAGVQHESLDSELCRIATMPFSSEHQYMATLHEQQDDTGVVRRVVLVKGAYERVLQLCESEMGPDGGLRPLNAQAATERADGLAAEGLRVLATAVGYLEPDAEFTRDALRGVLALSGIQAMLDPPRPSAIEAVRICHTAGIDVKMITGDHAATATAIAQKVGILAAQNDTDVRSDAVLTGTELAALDPADFTAAVARASVFARVSPEQKLRLVEALQSRGDVVAMTGDGVNDAPALQQADVGVAMGLGGTEVAKDAADMVLLDDDFATIEAAIEEGRGVFDNLTKFIVWTLPTNMAEGLVILVAIMLGTTLPIIPAQILWINMTTAVALGLMLAFEPKEEGIMERPPRDPKTPLLTGALGARIMLVSAMLVGGSWWMFNWEQDAGASLEEARTAALNLFVVVEAFYLFSCRSLTQPAWRLGFFSNKWIIVGVTTQAVGQLAITYVPFMNTVFQTAPIGVGVWLRILAVATLASVVVSVDKRVRRGVV